MFSQHPASPRLDSQFPPADTQLIFPEKTNPGAYIGTSLRGDETCRQKLRPGQLPVMSSVNLPAPARLPNGQVESIWHRTEVPGRRPGSNQSRAAEDV